MSPVAQQILQWAIWGVVMILFFAVIARARRKNLSSQNGNRLTLPVYFFGVGIVVFLLFSGMAAIAIAVPTSGASSGTKMGLIGLSLLSAIIVLANLVVKHVYDDTKIVYTTIVGKRKILQWSEISEITYNPAAGWFVIRDSRNRKFRFPKELKGIAAFAGKSVVMVDKRSIDEKALGELRKLQSGKAT